METTFAVITWIVSLDLGLRGVGAEQSLVRGPGFKASPILTTIYGHNAKCMRKKGRYIRRTPADENVQV